MPGVALVDTDGEVELVLVAAVVGVLVAVVAVVVDVDLLDDLLDDEHARERYDRPDDHH